MKKLKLKKNVKVVTTLLSFAMLFTVLPSMNLVAEDDTATIDQNGESVNLSLYDQLINSVSSSEVESIIGNYTDDELTNFYSGLTEEESNVLNEHLNTLYGNDYITEDTPETLVFTEAGPFMSPVNVSSAKRRLAKARSLSDSDGLVLNKTVSPTNDPNKFTVSLESYTTGTVHTVHSTVPVDITVVMDQSGSMGDKFDGNKPNSYSETRQYAMKNAINNFIEAVHNKYTVDSDHRIALVKFASNYGGEVESKIINELTYVNDDGKTLLENSVNNLPKSPIGATRIDKGIEKAKSIMVDNYSYNGKNTNRQKVVIVFTDGAPSSYNDFDISVANDAVSFSKNLKQNNVTVYTVGIMNGANPNQLFGSSYSYYEWQLPYNKLHSINCNGNIGDKWNGSEKDNAASNRFMNYLSSNYLSADSLGLSYNKENNFYDSYYYLIQTNFIRNKNGYYLTANDSSSLNDIFQTISNQIQSSSINLGSKTIIKDAVTQYFDIPSNVSDIRIYTASAKSDGTFEDKVRDTTLNPLIDPSTNSVSVDGFNFNDNFVSSTQKQDGTYGKKLIIEFEVTRKAEFIGGNDVPTNVWNSSGVYTSEGIEVKKFADEITTPKVNVPINEPDFDVNDKTIYKGSSLDGSTLFTIPDTSGWQYDYVDVDRSDITGDISPDDCNEYSLTLTYKPKSGGTLNSCGSPNDINGKSVTKVSHVHVLKPFLTVNLSDTYRYYGESYTLGNDINVSKQLEWKDTSDSHDNIPKPEGSMPYTVEDIELRYSVSTPGVEIDTDHSFVMPKKDVTIKVSASYGGNSIKDAVFNTKCDVNDHNCTDKTNSTYIVHYKTCSLTIHKSGGTVNEPYVFNIFDKAGNYNSISITPKSDNDSDSSRDVIINELPVGEYTVEEDGSMSWRYKSGLSNDRVSLSSQKPDDKIICTNTKESDKWLSKTTSVVSNIFNGSENHSYKGNTSNK